MIKKIKVRRLVEKVLKETRNLNSLSNVGLMKAFEDYITNVLPEEMRDDSATRKGMQEFLNSHYSGDIENYIQSKIKKLEEVMPKTLEEWGILVTGLKRIMTKDEDIIKLGVESGIVEGIFYRYLRKGLTTTVLSREWGAVKQEVDLTYSVFYFSNLRHEEGMLVYPFFYHIGIPINKLFHFKERSEKIDKAVKKQIRVMTTSEISNAQEGEVKSLKQQLQTLTVKELEEYANENFTPQQQEEMPENVREWSLYLKQLRKFFGLKTIDLKNYVDGLNLDEKNFIEVDVKGKKNVSYARVGQEFKNLLLEGAPYKHSFLECLSGNGSIFSGFNKNKNFYHWLGFERDNIEDRYYFLLERFLDLVKEKYQASGALAESKVMLDNKKVVLKELFHLDKITAGALHLTWQKYITRTEGTSEEDDLPYFIKMMPNTAEEWKPFVEQLNRYYKTSEEEVISWTIKNEVVDKPFTSYIMKGFTDKYSIFYIAKQYWHVEDFFTNIGIPVEVIVRGVKKKDKSIIEKIKDTVSTKEKENKIEDKEEVLTPVAYYVSQINVKELEEVGQRTSPKVREVLPENIREWIEWKRQLVKLLSMTEGDVINSLEKLPSLKTIKRSEYSKKVEISNTFLIDVILENNPYKHSIIELIDADVSNSVKSLDEYLSNYGVTVKSIERKYNNLVNNAQAFLHDKGR
jgi:hypothetical protein